MPRDIKSILKLRVPVIVRIGERRMALDDVLNLSPGAIIELPTPAERPLDLMVNNKVVGTGNAVKIGENFGVRVLEIGAPADRLQALTGKRPADADAEAEADKPAEADDAEPDRAETPQASSDETAPDEDNAEAVEAARSEQR